MNERRPQIAHNLYEDPRAAVAGLFFAWNLASKVIDEILYMGNEIDPKLVEEMDPIISRQRRKLEPYPLALRIGKAVYPAMFILKAVSVASSYAVRSLAGRSEKSGFDQFRGRCEQDPTLLSDSVNIL